MAGQVLGVGASRSFLSQVGKEPESDNETEARDQKCRPSTQKEQQMGSQRQADPIQ